MRSVHITDCAVNFYQVVEVPAKIGDEPAFFRLRAKAREPKHLKTPLDKALCDLMERWEADEAAEEAEAGDVA